MILVGSTAGYLLFQPTGSEPVGVGESWLTNWRYRKSHVINAQAGAGTNYQIPIKTYFTSGTDGIETVNYLVMGKVYLNSHSKTDFGDVRFTSSDGSTLLDYWMETKSDSNYAIFWVEVSEDLGSVRTIYIYYGNPTATSLSSISATFIREIDSGTPAKLTFGLEEGSGTTTADTSGNGNTGTLSGSPTWTTSGKYGKAISFDGTDDYVEVPNSASLVQTTFSIEFWAKPSSFTQYKRWMGKDTTPWGGNYYGWIVLWSYAGSSAVYLALENGGVNGANEKISQLVTVSLSTWVHLAFTFDGSYIYAYKNGVLFGSAVAVGTWTFATSTGPFRLGRDYGTDYFNGILDEVHFYNRALSSGEVSDLYNYYGYATTNYAGRVLVRKRTNPEPLNSATWGSEEPHSPNAPILSSPATGARFNPSTSVAFY
jgi:hypothetical protein